MDVVAGRNLSTYFDETHIRQILQAVNIVEVVSNYVSLKPRGKEMVGLCPFHDDSKPSLNVNLSKQIFKCFACGAGGDVIKFIMLREQLTFPEAVRLLADRAGIKLPQKRSENKPTGQLDRNELEQLNRWVAKFYREQFENPTTGQTAQNYVEKRQITPETARRFGLGWAPATWDSLKTAAQKADKPTAELIRLGLLIEKEQGGFYDRFRERLMFPVLDALGRVIAFGGRTLGDDPAKYINSPESELFNKSRSLYGLHAAKDSIVKNRIAIVVEGYTDCIMAHQFGLTNVVATLGTALTREHAQILSRYADQIVLVFDSDEAGRKAADRAVEVFFSQQIEVKIVTLPAGKDPCDFLLENGEKGKKAFEALVQGATEALEFKWKAAKEQIEESDTVGGHRRAVEEYLMLIARLIDNENLNEISEGYLLNRVAKLVGIGNQQVLRSVERYRKSKKPAISGENNEVGPMFDSRGRSEQAILEVLLNRADFFKRVREVVGGAEEFTVPVLRQVAERLWAYFEAGGEGELVEILAGCESTELCKTMMAMVERGEKRGNYEATLEGALKNLDRLKEDQQNEQERGVIKEAEAKYGKEARAALMREKQAKYRPDPRRLPLIVNK